MNARRRAVLRGSRAGLPGGFSPRLRWHGQYVATPGTSGLPGASTYMGFPISTPDEFVRFFVALGAVTVADRAQP